ncbi:MAG: hypothetical protein WCG47_13380, partial [Dermatophilaceae bacterium]
VPEPPAVRLGAGACAIGSGRLSGAAGTSTSAGPVKVVGFESAAVAGCAGEVPRARSLGSVRALELLSRWV